MTYSDLTDSVGIVVIGRNEGARLLRCLISLSGQGGRIVYVDSGSSDNSRTEARKLGAEVIELDTNRPFTAARARNAGFARLMDGTLPAPAYVQFVDGDCEVQKDWLATGQAFLDAHPDVAVVCGRRRERYPEASIWNHLIDAEWDTPVGQAKACGGDALMRADAVQAVGAFDPSLIAGEEPELCLRLRKAGWTIWRLNAEMTLHDAAMTSFGQWWQRNRRAGHAYAEGAAMHGAPPERHKVAEAIRALVWAVGIPTAALIGGLLTPWAFLLLLAWPLQILRLALCGVDPTHALFLTLAKLPEAQGVVVYWTGRLTRRRATLIEYK
jgi:GT2 family glycosyltransferase